MSIIFVRFRYFKFILGSHKTAFMGTFHKRKQKLRFINQSLQITDKTLQTYTNSDKNKNGNLLSKTFIDLEKK